MTAFPRRTAPARRCTPRCSATTPRRACTAGSTSSGTTATSAGATGSRSTPTSSSCFAATPARASCERAAGLVAAALALQAADRHRDAAARRCSAGGRCRWSRTGTCSPPPASRASELRHRPHARTAPSGPARPPSATSWCCTAGNAYRLDVLGETGRAAHPRRDRGRAARGAWTPATPPAAVPAVGRADHEGPRRVGRAAGPALLDARPAQRRGAGRRSRRALLCVCLEDRSPPDAPQAARPAAARRQRQPVVRQGASR